MFEKRAAVNAITDHAETRGHVFAAGSDDKERPCWSLVMEDV